MSSLFYNMAEHLPYINQSPSRLALRVKYSAYDILNFFCFLQKTGFNIL